MNTSRLNITGKTAKAFLNSKLTLLMMLVIVLFGFLALKLTPRTYNPEIIVPVVNISVARPYSDAPEMLNQIVKPLESLMRSIPGVDNTYGMALDDKAVVTVRFKVNENEEDSLVKVYNQINSNMDKMPPGTQMPLIQSVSLYDVPLLTINLYGDSASSAVLRKTALDTLEVLRAVPSVGKTWIMGSSPQSVWVWLNPEKMAQHAISLNKVKGLLSFNNTNIDAGTLETNGQKIPLRVEGALITNDDIANIVVGIDNAHVIKLKDIAKIENAPQNASRVSYYAKGKALGVDNIKLHPSITLAIARQKGSNGVDVANQVIKKLQQLVDSHQVISGNISYAITRNYGEDANDAVNTLVEHLGIAISTVVLLLLVFLGWRESSIVVLSIPLILFLVLGIGWISGQTINRITLFALILSLGLLVDDSIVVIENIHRHLMLGKEKNFARLIIRAANEIGKPTIVATFTVILALLPMGFVSGMMGPFMAPIPFNAPLAMLVSLVIAYTVVPYLAYRWLRAKAKIHSNNHERLDENDTILQTKYQRYFTQLVQMPKKRHRFYSGIILLMAIVLLQPLWQFIRPSGVNGPLSALGVMVKMLPDDNVDTFLLSIDAGANASLHKTKQLVSKLTPILQQSNEIIDYSIYFGEAAPDDFAAMARGDAFLQGSRYAQIRVNLTNKHHRTQGSHIIVKEIYSELKPVMALYPEAKIKLFESPPGPPVRSQMEAGLYGDNYEFLQKTADEISNTIYPTIYGMMNVDNSVGGNEQSYHIELDHQRISAAGLSSDEVGRDLTTYFNGMCASYQHSPGDKETKQIIFRLPDIQRKNIDAVSSLYFQNPLNEQISLKSIAHIITQDKQKPIYTRNEHPLVYLTGEVLDSSPAYAALAIDDKVHEKYGDKISIGNLGFKETEPGSGAKIDLLWLGEMRLTLDVFRDLGSAFMVALALIYILLTAFYQSFFVPLIIMGAIPLTIIGVFPGHWIMHQPFTATSMIGVIALAGIVVRNSLLLIDFIIEHERLGFSLDEAVLAAGKERLLPILLTAMAIILGSCVMLSDPVFGGLAISLIFGSFASTVLTLFLIPLIYMSWKKRR